MNLSKLLSGVTVTKMFQTLYGRMVVTHDVQVNRLQYDSRNVGRNDAFVAIKGQGLDGHKFITQAVNNGANVVVMDDDQSMPDSFFMHAGVVKIVVPDTRVALSQLSANYFEHPSRELLMVGVTGTNGKTTTTHLLRSILETSGSTAGMIGTIEYNVGSESIPASHTTPESLELNGLLRTMVEKKCTSAVMEVSSHALHQHRVAGIDFRAAVFTNLTQDHLDYHRTVEDYAAAKRLLFTGLESSAAAIVNADDSWGAYMAEQTRAKKMTYGHGSGADVQVKNVSLSVRGTRFTVHHEQSETEIESSLIGRFNVANILAAFATGVALGISNETLQKAIFGMKSVRGRFEQYTSPAGWTAIIDYAHTPDALQKALMAVKDIFGDEGRGRIITVFGCGGNRDRGKRSKMGAIAAAHSDLTIVTSDNPRHEDPGTIIEDILEGIPRGTNVQHDADRKNAIHQALSGAKNNDVVLIAGKGHEEYQVVGNEKIHFSDREVVEEYIRSHA